VGPKLTSFVFWLCVGMATLDTLMAYICTAVPALSGQAMDYAVLACLSAAGAVVYYFMLKDTA